MCTRQFTVLQDGLVGGGEKVLSSAVEVHQLLVFWAGRRSTHGSRCSGFHAAVFHCARHEAMANQELLWKFLFCM